MSRGGKAHQQRKGAKALYVEPSSVVQRVLDEREVKREERSEAQRAAWKRRKAVTLPKLRLPD
jgi:dsDNA-specific endonuclease/ATPase MutS2